MTIYIGIDKETWENIAVETSKDDVLEELEIIKTTAVLHATVAFK